MMADIEYRETPPDARQYLELFETTGWNSAYKANWKDLKQALDNSWYVVVAYQGSELVGIGRVVSDGVLYAMIYDMIVRPSHQGCGIGTTLLVKLVKKCKSAGMRDIQLFSARGKAPFYAKRGFVQRPADAPGMMLRKILSATG
jgi:GNAT superfamily N-acetyltransferase